MEPARHSSTGAIGGSVAARAWNPDRSSASPSHRATSASTAATDADDNAVEDDTIRSTPPGAGPTSTRTPIGRAEQGASHPVAVDRHSETVGPNLAGRVLSAKS